MFVYQIVKYSFHNKKTGIFNPKKEGCKMLEKVYTGVCLSVRQAGLMWCVVLLSAVGAVNYPPLAGAQGLALDPDRGGGVFSVCTLGMGN